MITAPNSLPTQAHQPDRETWLQFIGRSRNFIFSLLLHTLGLVILGTIIVEGISDPQPDFVNAEGLVVETPNPSADADDPMPKLQEPAGGEIADLKVPQLAMSALTTNNSSASFAMNSMSSIAGAIGNITGSTGGQGGGPGGLGIGPGSGTMVRFLGKPMKVKDVVLVLDVSSSMVNGSPGGPVKNEKTYEVLEREACNLVRGLKPENKFGVVVFAREARVYQEKLVAAHSDEKERAIHWIKQMTPMQTKDPRVEEDLKNFHHGTRADLALKAAFEMNPDMIFFVSDGEPTGTTVDAVLSQVKAAQAANNKLIDIHSIAYLADDGQKFMKDLAGQNRGTFREVNPKDLKDIK